MKAIITRNKRNALDTTINWMMGIKTEIRKPTTEEIESKKSKKSPYNLFDYTVAIGSSTAIIITNVIHPDVALANLAYYGSKRLLNKKLDKFNNPVICEDNNADTDIVEVPAEEAEEPIVVEGEIVDSPMSA